MEIAQEIKSVLFGVAAGDALGVPVEFKSREYLKENPVESITGYGTHNMPPGTWSDDSSLTFCLAEALTGDEALTGSYDLNQLANYFVLWYRNSYWTARGEVFDVGNTTREAIASLESGVEPCMAGSRDTTSNGNGSLMRILPLLFLIKNKPIEERFEITRQVSSVTHGHIRSVIACFYYIEFSRLLLFQKRQLPGKDLLLREDLLPGKVKMLIYKTLQVELPDFLTKISIKSEEIAFFDRLLKDNIYERVEEEIKSTGYVLHTLEASIWCLLTTGSYREAVLKAVNLGYDTDTTAAVTGGLAGLLYGYEDIPKDWIDTLARKKDIEDLSERLAEKFENKA